MFTARSGTHLQIAAIALGVLLLSACGSSDEAASENAAAAAARANVDAMSREHADDTTESSGAAEKAPARPVISETLPYAEIEDQLVYGYFVAPSDMFEPLPAVIMIHEWWGLNDNIRSMADLLAGEGYIVLAVDLYRGSTAKDAAEARQLMLSVVENPAQADENLKSAYEFVTEVAGAPGVASLGWCFGGGWSLNAAVLFPEELDASVIYYGQVTGDEDRLRPVTAPILGIFAEQDRGIKLETVRAFEAALRRLRKDHQIHIYPGVGHAFANPTGNSYDEEAADDAWRKTLGFLATHLKAGAT